MEDEIQLRVEEAYPIDIGRGIIRLDPTALLKLQLSPGDIVEISGKKKTTAKVWRADRQDWEQDLVRIDKFLRQNAGVSIGETVKIRKVGALVAKKVILKLPKDGTPEVAELQSIEQANDILKRSIIKRPVFKGDIVPIIYSMSESEAELISKSIAEHLTISRKPSKLIPLIVVDTEPSDSIVQVFEETTIELLDKTIQIPADEKESAFMFSIKHVNQTLKPHDLAIMMNENTGEITLCETKDTFISGTKNVQKKIVFSPSVFEIPKKSNISNCVSVMIPFSPEFDNVYGCINDACYEIGMPCHKADDFWHHSAIIQDIFELIFRSSNVIVDFTYKNPNVFYEAGIAHALGKTVIPITQNINDIPFDLRHHRHILYQNDREGLKKLKRDLISKLNFEKNRE
jgi:hypothetical protein